MLETHVDDSDLDAWLTRLDGAPAVLQLPSDRGRPDRLADIRAQVRFALSADVSALRRLADELGVDLYDVLLGAWQVLLFRYTGESDVVIGCHGARSMPADSSRALILRQPVDADAPFRETVTRVAQRMREAAADGPVDVRALVTAMGAEPGAGKHPVYQAAFVQGAGATTAPGSPPAAPGRGSDFAPCDVVLQWTVDGARITAQLDYAPDMYDAGRIRRMAAHLENLVASALAEPDTPVARQPILTDEERRRLREWNSTARPHDRQRPVAALFAPQATRTPDAVAVEFGPTSLSYAELDDRAGRLAALLRQRGVGPDVTVAISMDRSLELVVSVLAVLQAGGAYVPIDPTYPAARRAYMLEHSRARLLLAQRGSSSDVLAAGETEVLEVDLDNLDLDERFSPPSTDAHGAHLAYVIYTSGSTGQPKGVALTQQALTNLIEWQIARPGFAHGARTLQFSSLSFDVSFQELLSTWASGGTLVLVPDAVRREPRGLLDHLVAHDVERLFLPFVALRGLADAAVSSGRYPQRLREVYTAGEQLVVDDTLRTFFAQLPDCTLENQYGPSESHVVTAYTLPRDPALWPALPSIGAPIANAAVHILDEAGEQQPIGVPGELHIGGVCLARGYLGQPEKTAERFVSHPLAGDDGRLYRTGDLASWQDDGTVKFLGRADDQVKFRGFRIEPGEIGAVLSGYPGVRQCVATVAEIAGIGPRLAAYVLPAGDTVVELEDLHRFARDRLPDYMVPSHVVVVDALPMTPSGKVSVRDLPVPSFDRRILGTAYQEPRSTEERELAAIWQRLLGVEDLGVHDDFFDLGGDSLMAVEMFEQIRQRFGVDLPLGALAQSPTVAGLVEHLSPNDPSQEWRSLVPLREEGDAPALFLVHGGKGNVASFPRLARELPDGRPVYAFQWDGLDGSHGSRSISAMARTYLAEVRRVQPEGPYLLAGQCIGGLIIREMARQLIAEGEDVPLLVMYDTPNVDSDDFRLVRWLPAPPPALRGLVNRAAGAVSNLLRLLAGKRPRKSFVRVRLDALRRRPSQAVEDREAYIEMVMVRAAWRHRVRPLDVPTVFVHSGRQTGLGIALAGRWQDGMMGWSAHATSARFSDHQVQTGHNDVPYAPRAVALLSEALDTVDASGSRMEQETLGRRSA